MQKRLSTLILWTFASLMSGCVQQAVNEGITRYDRNKDGLIDRIRSYSGSGVALEWSDEDFDGTFETYGSRYLDHPLKPQKTIPPPP